MSANYTQFDWASDRQARTTWDEDEFVEAIDRRIRKRSKANKRNITKTGRRRAE